MIGYSLIFYRSHKFMIVSVLMVVYTLVLSSCDKQRVFEDYYTTNNNVWHSDSIADFQFDIQQPNENYNLLFNVRNLESYSYSNLWFFVDIVAPDLTILRDTVECQLALPNGKWLGKGTGGVYHSQFSYRFDITFPEKGIYSISLQQAMREVNLKGISDIGLRIEKN
jgi:gliding motility-associated lipoprotein GldH